VALPTKDIELVQTMRTHLLSIALFLVLVLSSPSASAETVYFNNADYGPGANLQIGDVTLSMGAWASMAGAATVSGQGLGLDGGMGQIYEFNEQITQINGDHVNYGYNDFQEPGVLSLTAPGIIDSIALLPFARVYSSSGDLLPDQPQFDIYCSLNFASDHPHVTPGTATTLYWNGPGQVYAVDIGIGHNSPLEYWLNLDAGNTAELGFTILSLDYTPVPEPGAVCLFAAGSFALFYVNRKRRKPIL